MYSIKIMTKLFAFTIPAAIITAVASSVNYAGSGNKNRTQSPTVCGRALFVGFAFLIGLLAAHGAQAQATFIVTRIDDRNAVCASGVDCSLREAVNAANAAATNDTITFNIPATSCSAAGVCTITLMNDIQINNSGSLTINGTGANRLTIDGGAGTNRIFYSDGATFTLSGVTLTGGNGTGANFSNFGGAICANGGTTMISGVYFNANSAVNFGGGIFFTGGTNHRVENSTFSGNSTASNSVGGGIYISDANLAVVNTTLTGNSAAAGGGIYVDGRSGTLTLRGDTITANTAGQSGGGVVIRTTLDFGNTIIAGNTATSGQPEIFLDDFGRGEPGTATSRGYNLVGDAAGKSADTGRNTITYQTTDIRDTPPLLGALTITNGGTTPTRALMTGSPAIDKGFSFGLITDQRGFTRPFDNPSIANATGGDGADIGAFEVQAAPTAASVSISGRVSVGDGRGLIKAIVYLTDQQGNTRAARTSAFGYFHFEDVAAGETYIVQVVSKRYFFTPQVLTVNEDVADLMRIARTNAFGYYQFNEVAAGQTYIFDVSSKRYRFLTRAVSISEDLSGFDFVAEK